jgi:hypothetical protein
LQKYHPNAEHVPNEELLELRPDLSYVENLVKILEKSIKELRKKGIPMVKVMWEHHGTQDITWETKEWIKKKYPDLLR